METYFTEIPERWYTEVVKTTKTLYNKISGKAAITKITDSTNFIGVINDDWKISAGSTYWKDFHAEYISPKNLLKLYDVDDTQEDFNWLSDHVDGETQYIVLHEKDFPNGYTKPSSSGYLKHGEGYTFTCRRFESERNNATAILWPIGGYSGFYAYECKPLVEVNKVNNNNKSKQNDKIRNEKCKIDRLVPTISKGCRFTGRSISGKIRPATISCGQTRDRAKSISC